MGAGIRAGTATGLPAGGHGADIAADMGADMGAGTASGLPSGGHGLGMERRWSGHGSWHGADIGADIGEGMEAWSGHQHSYRLDGERTQSGHGADRAKTRHGTDIKLITKFQ